MSYEWVESGNSLQKTYNEYRDNIKYFIDIISFEFSTLHHFPEVTFLYKQCKYHKPFMEASLFIAYLISLSLRVIDDPVIKLSECNTSRRQYKYKQRE